MKLVKRIGTLLMALMLCMVAAMPAIAEDAKEPVTLHIMWAQDTTASGLEDVIEEQLALQYPYITIEWEIMTWEDMPSKMQQYMQSGMPDIVMAKSQDANNYGEYGVWADLSGTDYIDKVLESTLPGITFDGKVLGLPYIGTYGGVFYNRKLFEQYNIEIPQTRDELFAVCETFKANGITPFATHWLDSWFVGWELGVITGGELMSTSATWGNEFRDGKRNAEDEDFQLGFNMMQYIHDNTWEDAYSVEQTTCDARFVSGEAAMSMDGSWASGNYAVLDPEFDYGLFPFPTVKGDGCLNMEPNATLFKRSSTTNGDAVDDFMRMMVSPEMASAYSQHVAEASLIKGATSFVTPAQPDIDYYASLGRVRDQNMITNQIPYSEFISEYANDFTEFLNGGVTLDVVIQRANDRRSVCGQ